MLIQQCLYVHIRETGVTADITIDGLTIKNLATFETKIVHLDVVGLSLELELDVPLLRVSFFLPFIFLSAKLKINTLYCILKYSRIQKQNLDFNINSFESRWFWSDWISHEILTEQWKKSDVYHEKIELIHPLVPFLLLIII